MLIRPALARDLNQMYAIFLRNEEMDTNQPLTALEPVDLRFTLQTGILHVAEIDGMVRGFAGAIVRNEISFLTDLFVLPDMQSQQLGKLLLQSVMPADGLIHCTMSSNDPRALALYIRSGMRPQWPNFILTLQKSDLRGVLESGIELVEADITDVAFVQIDAEIGGRWRPLEHRHWFEQQQGLPFWFRRAGKVLGYGYVRLGAGTLTDPGACMLGPIGVYKMEDATDCVLAALRIALAHVDVVDIDIPGAHPSLKPLLEKGFRITYVETFVSSAKTPFFDDRRYISSGSNLL